MSMDNIDFKLTKDESERTLHTWRSEIVDEVKRDSEVVQLKPKAINNTFSSSNSSSQNDSNSRDTT